MDRTPDLDLAARVAAWHNRHPLARRIGPAQVQAMGVVALPFVAPAGKRRAPLRPVFRPAQLAPLSTAAVARFALRQGTSTRTGPEDWPQRDLEIDTRAQGGATVEWRYLRTAAIDLRDRRTRVLIGGGKNVQVIGQRLWSRPRAIGATALLACTLTAAAALLGRFSVPGQPAGETLLARHSASGSAVDPAAPASAPAGATSQPGGTAAHGTAAASAPSAGASHTRAGDDPHGASSAMPAMARSAAPEAPPTPLSAASATVASASAAVATAASAPGDIRPQLTAAARATARREAEQMRALGTEKGGVEAAAAALAASGSASGKVYAVATPPTRTRSAAQLRIVLMNAPTEPEPGRPHAEVMQTGDGWRTVVWPYGSREAAERLRATLSERGISAEVIEF
jgi:hypothetical protein